MIELINVGFRYKEKVIFDNLNLVIGASQCWAVLGPNGVGKSSLMECIAGIKAVTSGQIKFGRMIRSVAMVRQKQIIDLDIKVIEMVLLGRAKYLKWWEVPSDIDFKLALEALEKVGGRSWSERLVSTLSGGELQLVMIARALVGQPDVLILDEPTAHLDYGNQMRVMEMVKSLVQDHGITVLFVTHQPELALDYAQMVIMFGDKSIKAGKVKKLLNDNSVKELYGLISKSK